MKDARNGELERQYHTERMAILGDESMSWEKKMRALLELFNRYRNKKEKDRAKG